MVTALASAAVACVEEETLAPRPLADAGGDAGAALPGNADGRDLDPANGDPALDIAASQLFFDNGAPWVRVVFHAAWPPPRELASWSCTVLLGTQNAPVATYAVQSRNGGKLVSVSDGIDEAKLRYEGEANGFRVLFGGATLAFDRYGLDCTVQRTPDGATAEDTSGNFAVGEKIQRSFGP